MRDLHRAHDDQRRQRIGQQMLEHDTRATQPQATRRFHVFLAALDQRRRARGTGVVGPLHAHQREDDLVHAFAQHRDEDQRHQDRGKSELDIHDAHQDALEAPAHIGGEHAEQTAQRERDHAARHAHQQRHAQAVENGRQHVPALPVRAEQVLATGFQA